MFVDFGNELKSSLHRNDSSLSSLTLRPLRPLRLNHSETTVNDRICGESAIAPKKTPAKIGRELINQGASTKLVSASTAPLSGMFGKIWQNLWLWLQYAKKTRPKLVGS